MVMMIMCIIKRKFTSMLKMQIMMYITILMIKVIMMFNIM